MSLVLLSAESEASDIRITAGEDDYAMSLGAEAQAHRCEISGSFAVADFRVTGARAQISDCRSETPQIGLLVSDDYGQFGLIVVNGVTGVELDENAQGNQLALVAYNADVGLVCDGVDNVCEIAVLEADQDGAQIGGHRNRVRGVVFGPSRNGVVISGDYNNVQVTVDQPGGDADDTYDAVNITGTASRNMLTNSRLGPRLIGNQTRYAVNLDGTGECNMIWGNDLGDPDDYANQPSIQDLANNTQWVFPNDVTYGDNLTDCGSGS